MTYRQCIVAAFTVVAAIAGCNLIAARSGLQCASDQDCAAYGPEFENTRCSERGVCEAIVVPEGGVFDGRCSSSLQCQVALKGAARCVNGTCVSLEPTDGTTCRYIGQPEQDEAMLFGMLLPMNGQAANEYAIAERVALQIVEAWNVAALSGAARRLGAVVCDEGSEGAIPKLKGLSPAFVLGPFMNAAGRKVLTSEPELVAFAPTVDDLSIAQVDVRRRLVSCIPNSSLLVAPTQKAIGLLRERLEEEREAPAKVVVVNTNDEGDVAFAGALESGLSFGGTPAVQSEHYKRETVTYNAYTDTSGQLVVVADSIARAKPDLVVLTSVVMTDPFIKALDGRWKGRNGSYPLPKILLTGSSEALSVYLKARGDVETQRYFAVEWRRSSSQLANWENLRSSIAAFSGISSVPRAAGFANDCLYTALYSALAGAASGGTSMTFVDQEKTNSGLAFAAGGDDNTAVRLIADDIQKAVGFLGTTPLKTKLLGTSVDFGLLATRTPAGDSELRCVAAAGDRKGEWISSNVSFDPTTGEPNGTFSCN